MADRIDELKEILIDVVTRQTQIEQGLHMLLDALHVQLPLITEMSGRLAGIEADMVNVTKGITSGIDGVSRTDSDG